MMPIHPLKEWRASVGISQVELAATVDTTAPNLSRIEQGGYPSGDLAERICTATGILLESHRASPPRQPSEIRKTAAIGAGRCNLISFAMTDEELQTLEGRAGAESAHLAARRIVLAHLRRKQTTLPPPKRTPKKQKQLSLFPKSIPIH